MWLLGTKDNMSAQTGKRARNSFMKQSQIKASTNSGKSRSKSRILTNAVIGTWILLCALAAVVVVVPAASPATGAAGADLLRAVVGPQPVALLESTSFKMQDKLHQLLFVASGYYDLDTSYFGAQYTVTHLGDDPKLRDRVTMAYYDAGHQMYTDMPSLKKLKEDAAAFVKAAVPVEMR